MIDPKSAVAAEVVPDEDGAASSAPRSSGSRVARSLGAVMLGNALTPLVGALSGPVLAQSLGVDGRGQVAAATAPLMFGMTIGTLGMPESLTFRVASRGLLERRAARWALGLVTLAGGCLLAIILALRGPLSDHDRTTQTLMWFAGLFLVPSLWVLLLRGFAAGLQLFRFVAAEQVVSAVSKAAILVVCLVVGGLTPAEAMISVAAPAVLGGLVYLAVWRRMRATIRPEPATGRQAAREVRSYGLRVWIGALGAVLMFRLDQLLVAPLAGVRELGLYIVAVNVAEILSIVVDAVRDVTFATDAADNDTERAAAIGRLSTALAAVIGAAMIATAPLLVPLVFGAGFRGSVAPMIVLVVSIVLLVSGAIAGSVLTARGRPGLCSLALVAGAAVNALLLVLLAPAHGALGASVATLVGNSVFTAVTIVLARRHAGLAPLALFGLRRADLAAVRSAVSIRRAAARSS
jgi:O-antigen/teichoic acid export membrane protein